MTIPTKFNSEGLLDPGTYTATFAELRQSILVNGDGTSSTWDRDWRLQLTYNAEVLVKQLQAVGIDKIYLDGSFVEDKDHPNDIDGYFDPNLSAFNKDDMEKFGQIVLQLNQIDPHKVWTWNPRSRKQYRGYPKLQLPMWLFYRVEFYPHLGTSSGIQDVHGNELQFPSAFRQSRVTSKEKGIIQII